VLIDLAPGEEGRRMNEPQLLPGAACTPLPSPRPGRRVLVVEDRAELADTLALVLRLAGHEVQTAYNGPAALEAALVFRPEVVLLDIGLPGMDGYEVARRLRQGAAPPADTRGELVLVALTGSRPEVDNELFRAAGFDRHLLKPIEPDELCRVIAAP
jgi:CheY-like chemotaxis protein